nr:uncharacterized protein LOC109155276 isoform X2 [Ipomoea batatas]
MHRRKLVIRNNMLQQVWCVSELDTRRRQTISHQVAVKHWDDHHAKQAGSMRICRNIITFITIKNICLVCRSTGMVIMQNKLVLLVVLYPLDLAHSVLKNQKEQKSFDWDDAKTTLVYNAWEMKAKIRYADYISRLRKNQRSVYIPPEIWTKWNEVWNSEEGKKKTELAKKNRRGGVLNGVAQSTHTTGSTPHVKVAAQLEQVAMQREMLTGTGEQVDDNELYYDVVGGHDKKRRIYGLGSYGCSIVNGSTSDNTSGNMTPTSRPPDNATSASVQDEIQSLKATILLMQQRLDVIDCGRAGTSSSPPSQTD